MSVVNGSLVVAVRQHIKEQAVVRAVASTLEMKISSTAGTISARSSGNSSSEKPPITTGGNSTDFNDIEEVSTLVKATPAASSSSNAYSAAVTFIDTEIAKVRTSLLECF